METSEHQGSLPERLLTLLEQQKQYLRKSDLRRYEAASLEVDALLREWSNGQNPDRTQDDRRKAVMDALEQLTLMVAASRQVLSDKIRRIRRHRRAVSAYQEGG